MYGKVFESLFSGSLYGKCEAACMMQVLIVFADEDGMVDMSFDAIVGRVGWDREFVRKGMHDLMQPDPISRTEGEDGRRILPVTPCHSDSPEGVNGFVLVNHSKYRDIAKREEKRKHDRERQRASRERRGGKPENDAKTANVTPCHTLSQPVTKSRLSEAEADTEPEEETAPTARNASAFDVGFDAFWAVVHRKEGKKAAKKQFKTAVVSVRKERNCTEGDAIAYLVTRMKVFARSPQAKDEVKGTLHPATWLSQGRYDDDDSVWRCAEGANTDDYRKQWNAKAKRTTGSEPVRIGSLIDERG